MIFVGTSIKGQPRGFYTTPKVFMIQYIQNKRLRWKYQEISKLTIAEKNRIIPTA